jgi:hypothetical protein
MRYLIGSGWLCPFWSLWCGAEVLGNVIVVESAEVAILGLIFIIAEDKIGPVDLVGYWAVELWS